MTNHLEIGGTLDGKSVTLHIGGDHDGWFLDPNGERLRQATTAEIESAKRFFWNCDENGNPKQA